MLDRNKILAEIGNLCEQDTFVSELAKVVMPEDFGLKRSTSVEALGVWSVFELLTATDEQWQQAYENTLYWYERLKDED